MADYRDILDPYSASKAQQREITAAVGVAVAVDTGTSYTYVLTDANGYKRHSNAAAIAATVPPDSSVAFPLGTKLTAEQMGAGQVTIVAGSGVTIHQPETLALALKERWSVATITKVGANEWTLAGDMSEAQWVPENAVMHIDLVNDRAWWEDSEEEDGSIAINTVLGEDTNLEGSLGVVTTYNPVNLTANGYTFADDEKPAFIGQLLTLLLAGATMVFKFKKGATGSDGSFVMMSQGGQNKAVELDFNIGAATNGKLEAYAYSGDFDLLSDADQMNKGEGVINRVGVTVVPASRFEFAANGRTAYPGVITTAEYPTADAGEIICAGISLRNTDSLQEITIYAALPSSVGLPALTA